MLLFILLPRNWNEFPTVTTISSFNHPVTELHFPAVTICTDSQYYVYGMARTLMNM